MTPHPLTSTYRRGYVVRAQVALILALSATIAAFALPSGERNVSLIDTTTICVFYDVPPPTQSTVVFSPHPVEVSDAVVVTDPFPATTLDLSDQIAPPASAPWWTDTATEAGRGRAQ